MRKCHKNLEVWKQSIKLVQMIYSATNSLPPSEKYGLSSQMKRAAVSVPANIAEGAARQWKKESIQFFTIARGSLSELDTLIEICKSLSFLSNSLTLSLLTSQIDKVDILLSGLIRYKRRS